MPKHDPRQAPDTVEVRPIPVTALALTYQIELSPGRSIAYQVPLPAESDLADLNERLDTLHDATERQLARVQLPQARGKLKIASVQLKLQENLYAKTKALNEARWTQSHKQGVFRMSEAQSSALDNIATTVAKWRADLPILEWEIARLQAVIDGRTPPEELPAIAEAAE